MQFKILLGHGTVGFHICPQKSAYFQKNAVNGGARSYSLGQAQAKITGWAENELKAALRRRTWGADGQGAQHELAMCPCSPERQTYPGLRPKQYGQQVHGKESSPLLCCLRPPCVCIQLWCLQHKDMDLLEWIQGAQPQTITEDWSTSSMERGSESWGCSGEDNYNTFQHLKGPTRKLQREFWQQHGVTEQGIMASKWKKVSLH